MRKLIFFISLFFLLTSCSKNEPKELILSTNSWIGYAPLFYAKERGYLDEINIKLITSVSLAESANIFLVSKADLLTITQHEYNLLKKDITSLTPIILIDRSNGGDMILSNCTIEELKSSKKIDVYLEVDSINKELIESFIMQQQLSMQNLNFINKDQAKILNLAFTTKRDMLIVTYAPNNLALMKKGFREIASTASNKELLVIDAIATTKSKLKSEQSRLKELKRIIDRSIVEIQQDPRGAHELTKKYLNNLSLQEFESSLKDIEWINNPKEELIEKLDTLGYKKEDILR